MKPQIIIPVSLLTILFFLSANVLHASNKKQKIKTEQSGFKVNELNSHPTGADHSGIPPVSNRPGKQHHKDTEKDHQGPKDATHRRSHSEEDGKHHHFHMHRAKKAKKHTSLVCFLAKLLLVITHICLLIYVYHSTLAHAVH